MIEPRLNYVTCPGAAAGKAGEQHRKAYWEWNQTGDAGHPHIMLCVHGLTRQGRDFDVLAQELSQYGRVICPDVVGRGRSDWLADPMAYGVPQYAIDMVLLLQQLHTQAPIQMLDWLGTSMGGLIGMAVASNPALPLPVRVRKLLLNDVGPVLEWPALQRIAQYVGQAPLFHSQQEAADALRVLAAGFGPHTDAQWLALSKPMLQATEDGHWKLHYDPQIAVPMRGMTQEQSLHGQSVLWQLYDAIEAQTLLVRGADSDLITQASAHEMAQRGPRARYIELEGVGHAPTFVADDQVAIAKDFFVG
jgi:pimeloyl-ACP methyl ester carboxylesterase